MENRIIKFRAWNEELKSMSKPFSFGQVLNFNDKNIKSITDEIILQFADLKDKNNKDCFEGDIIKQGNLVRVLEKQMSCGSCCSQVIGIGTSGEGHTDFINLKEDFEIIGNIYENAELFIE